MATSIELIIVLLLGLISLSLCNGLSILLVLVHGPVEDVIILKSFTNEEITEDLAEVGVIGFIVKTKRAGVVEIDGEFVGEATAEHFRRRRHLLLHDSIVLLLLGSSLETLPGQGTTAEVEHDIAE